MDVSFGLREHGKPILLEDCSTGVSYRNRAGLTRLDVTLRLTCENGRICRRCGSRNRAWEGKPGAEPERTQKTASGCTVPWFLVELVMQCAALYAMI